MFRMRLAGTLALPPQAGVYAFLSLVAFHPANDFPCLFMPTSPKASSIFKLNAGFIPIDEATAPRSVFLSTARQDRSCQIPRPAGTELPGYLAGNGRLP